MHQYRNLPPLLKVFGRTVRYAAAIYLVFGMVLAITWVVFQFVASRAALTIAASIFFAGFSLSIVLVVVGVAVTIIVLEQVIIDEVNRAILTIQRVIIEGVPPHDE